MSSVGCCAGSKVSAGGAPHAGKSQADESFKPKTAAMDSKDLLWTLLEEFRKHLEKIAGKQSEAELQKLEGSLRAASERWSSEMTAGPAGVAAAGAAAAVTGATAAAGGGL